jgi:hypothetical protein
MPVFPTTGDFPLAGVASLPNVTIAYPGEHWTNRIANADIVPGTAVVPTNLNGKLAVRAATADDTAARMGIALRPIDVPDLATDSQYTTSLGPNEIKNLPIKTGQYVDQWYSGVFLISLVVPRAWKPAELVGWNVAGARPTGKSGTGSWDVVTDEADAFGEVMEFRPFSANGQEGLLTVRSLRGQF